jgi:hypothetical protein
MNWQVVFSTLIALGGSTVLAQALKAFTDRRKVKVDAADVVSDSALAQLARMEKRLNYVEDENIAFRRALKEHERWDRMVIAKLDSLGVTVPTAPDLWGDDRPGRAAGQ